MKKCIIILLISFTSFGQGNLVTREIFGNRNTKGWNTFIGGVSSTISTSAQLATKLGISNNRIRNFVVVGSDIKCKITGSYAIPGNCFRNPVLGITYYNDISGLVDILNLECFGGSYGETNLIWVNFPNVITAIQAFSYTPNLKIVELPQATSVFLETFAYSNKKIIYIPRCTSLGASSLDDGSFFNTTGSPYIYCHPSLATNNAGAPDGDLAYAISQGATVRYVTNFTPPNPITSLTTGTITSTSVQLNFTNPTGSTNAYDFCEIYKKDINGNWLYISEIASGDIVSGLTTGTTYDFKIVARDIFYNGTESFITASTL